MFKNNRTPLLVVTVLVMSLSLGLMAFSPFTTENAGGPNGPGGPGRGSGDNTYLAEALGITIEELQAAVEEARSNSDGQDFSEALAAVLGISAEALGTARDTARDAALAQALADGNITQEEYDQFVARQSLQEYIDRDEMLAGALGISVSEFQAAQDEGKRIPDLLDELGISQEDFQAAVGAAQEAALAQAVSDGVISQEQADEFGQDGFGGRGPGSKGGPGGRDGKGEGKGPDENQPAEDNS